MPKYRVMVAQFPGNNSTRIEVTNWVTRQVVKMAKDPLIGEDGVYMWHKADTPISMTRNQCLIAAEAMGVDWVLMLDNDVHPDCIAPKDGAKPFWESSWEFIQANMATPCVIAAPYCGPPPEESVYVFRWMNRETGNPNPDLSLGMYDRHEAASMKGIQRAGALPTGVMLIDMRAVKQLDDWKKQKTGLAGPRFYYEWKGDGEKICDSCGSHSAGPQAEKASTEDVTFSRDLLYAGVPIYCNWDAWAGHYKTKLVRPPQVPGPNVIATQFREWGERLAPLSLSSLKDPATLAKT